MSESYYSRWMRWMFNLFPVYRRTGARISYISSDWQEVHIKLPLNWKTRNYVGTIFGGSMYAAVDPIYMVMLIRLLGRKYIVWDKAATIQFKQPGRNVLTAKFIVSSEELASIRAALEAQKKLDRVYKIDLVDKGGNICAVVEKTIHFKKKDG
jgi:acyl-coenzyme A thioesterase PaaI-like protein